MWPANAVEADWEIELGGHAPIIDVRWSGFVDLRRSPEKVCDLAEVLQLPALAPALVRLNSPESLLYTAKCDVWQVAEIDPLEFDAPQETPAQGMAVYLDLVPCAPQLWSDHDRAIAWCRALCTCLRNAPLRCSRVDLVIRRARRASELEDEIGVTAYLAACGPTVKAASAQLESLLAIFADSIETTGTRGPLRSTLQ
jgi:hypothetical protein